MGVDRSIITAASSSKSIITTSIEVTKKRGRVVVIGFIPMDIAKDPFMKKEIELMFCLLILLLYPYLMEIKFLKVGSYARLMQ